METLENLELVLKSSDHGDTAITLYPYKGFDFFDIPTGNEVVYNDNSYQFSLNNIAAIPSAIYINDESYNIELIEGCDFQLSDNSKPFLQSYGAIKIECEILGQRYVSKSIAVMVSTNDINNGISNMVQYIYDNCESYLYEEHKFSEISTGIKNNEIVSMEAKIAQLKKTLQVYSDAYEYIRVNPHAKLRTAALVTSFDKMGTVSSDTINYIINHADELTAVNYDTGIKYNNTFYQPNRVLSNHNTYSYDTYENQVIVGFLRYLIDDISNMITDIQKKTYTKPAIVQNGYLDSMYEIFSRSIKKISQYQIELEKYKEQFKQMYYFYSKLLGIKGINVKNVPQYTSVFQSIKIYNIIYKAIFEWFSVGNYDLGRDELLLSFISTSKIYEYYCLVKVLSYLNHKTDFQFTYSKRLKYVVNNQFYINTRYNNMFVFSRDSLQISLYFQPVIYENDFATNGIGLFRNTSTNSEIGNTNRGWTYTPDFLFKIESPDRTDYIIMDAKYSSSANIRSHQLHKLVYKYLFSISPLNIKDRIIGLYIICGKSSGADGEDVIHDLARKINHKITPFAEILVMTGQDTGDEIVPNIIYKTISPEDQI